MPQKVLVIDDSPAVHNLLRVRLKDEPIAIYSAETGESGLEMARTLLPDLILLDVEMPSLDGFEVCRRLKLDPALLNIPILFLTGAASTEQKIQGLDLGAVDYVAKPFDPAELRARVRVALRLKFMMDLLGNKGQIDALTGLWNRRYFEQRFQAELSLSRRSRRPLGVLLLDLDHFQAINERFGNSIGDQTLRHVAGLLTQAVRTEDVVCRHDAEQFAIITPNVGQGATVLAQRLRSAIEAMSLNFGGQQLKLTASFGVACADQDPDKSLIDRAAAALQKARQAGGNRVES